MSEPGTLEDAALLTRIAAQDRDAFAELFRRYAVRVKAFMMRSGMAAEDADEIAQEVMVSVWRKAASFDPSKAGVSTWVFAIARNRRIDTLRKRARPAPDPDDPMFQPDPEPDGARILGAQQIEARMREALGTLPEEQREVLRAAFYHGLSHGEIARLHDLPLGTVKSRIRLAFKALRETLGEDAVEAYRDD